MYNAIGIKEKSYDLKYALGDRKRKISKIAQSFIANRINFETIKKYSFNLRNVELHILRIF